MLGSTVCKTAVLSRQATDVSGLWRLAAMSLVGAHIGQPVVGWGQDCTRGCASVLLICLQDYIQRLMAEKSDLDKRFHGMKDELITRLQNACQQRDDARAQVSGSVNSSRQATLWGLYVDWDQYWLLTLTENGIAPMSVAGDQRFKLPWLWRVLSPLTSWLLPSHCCRQWRWRPA